MAGDSSENDLLLLRARASHNLEVLHATRLYPDMEISAAYRKYKESLGEIPVVLYASRTSPLAPALKAVAARLSVRPCSRPGCRGSQYLESICSGCIEGQAGYKTKWTCRLCLHRDLSKEDLDQWIIKLSSFSKESFSPKP